jgi:integrase
MPARFSDDKKRQSFYFDTKEEGNKYLQTRLKLSASNHSVRMPMSDQIFLEELRTLCGSNDGIRQAVAFYQKTVLSVKKHGSVFDMVADYRSWQGTMNRTPDGIKAMKHWAGKFEAAFGNEKPTELTYSGLSGWINGFPGGKGHSGRRNAYVFAHALLNWAQKHEWIGQDILKGMEKPQVNVLKNIMPVATFSAILNACAANDEFRSILPVIALQGFAGVRSKELVGINVNQSNVVFWSDFDWADGTLHIRDEVAKQTTRKNGDERWITLDPAAIAWLQTVAQRSGAVFAGNRDNFGEIKKALLKVAKQKMERNTLRHSYATYGISVGSLALVAKNMGDTESRVKNTYQDPSIKPQAGAAWFALRPQAPDNVVSMSTAASLAPSRHCLP